MELDERSSRRHEVAQLLDSCRPDARDRVEVVDGCERPVLGSIVHDLLRGDRSHAGKLVELLDRRRRQADAGRSQHRRPLSSHRPPAPRHRRTRLGTRHLNAVDERCSEVQRREIGVRARAPPARRTASAILRAVAKPVETGSPDLAHDVNDESRTEQAPPRPARAERRRLRARSPPQPARGAAPPTRAARAPRPHRPERSSGRRRSARSHGRRRTAHRWFTPSSREREIAPGAGRALRDEVDELAGHDHGPRKLGAVECGSTRSEARANATSSSSPMSAGTCRRSRIFPFTCTTTSTVSTSSIDGSATGHGASHSRSCPSRDQSSSATCGAYGWISETTVSAAKRESRPARLARELVDELHHGGDRRC